MRREFAQVSGLLPDTNEQFVFHFFPNLHLSLSALKWGVEREEKGRKGGLQIARYCVCLQRVPTCLQMHWRVQHLQGEIDKSGGKLFHGNNKQNL